MRDAFRHAIAAAVLAGLLGPLQPAEAQSNCQALKFKAAGVASKLKAACHSRAAKAGTAVDPACLAAADDKLARKWTRAEGAGDCGTSGDAAAGVSVTEQCLTAIAAVVDPPAPPASPCCDLGDSCMHGIPDADCIDMFGGTPGPADSVCDGATGTCGAPPAEAGRCCMVADGSFCNAGPTLDLSGCVPPTFLDFVVGICSPSGSCVLP